MKKYFKIIPNSEINEPCYKVWLNWDSNDGDYISQTVTFPKKVFEEDETLQIVLSFLGHGYFGELFNGGWDDSQYGHYVSDTKVEGLIDFIVANGLEVRDYGSEICHSVHDIIVTYFDEHRVAYDVQLVNFDTLYPTGDKAIEDLESKIKKWFQKE